MRFDNISQLPKKLQDQAKKKLEKSGKKVVGRAKHEKIEGRSYIQHIMHLAIEDRWPGETLEDYRAVSGRKFEIDFAFAQEKLAIEVDGWMYHGKFKADFQRDRLKDRMLTMEGWTVLRFFYAEITTQMQEVVIPDIEHCLALARSR